MRSRGFSTSLSTSSSEPESVSQIGQRLRSSESFPFGSLSKNEYTLIAPLPATRTRTAPEMNLLRKTAEYSAGLLAYTLLAPALSVLVKDQKPPTAWLKSKTSRLSVGRASIAARGGGFSLVVNGLGPVPGLNPRGWRINPPPKPSVTCSGPFILSGLRPTVAQFCPPACQLLQTLAAGLPLTTLAMEAVAKMS